MSPYQFSNQMCNLEGIFILEFQIWHCLNFFRTCWIIYYLQITSLMTLLTSLSNYIFLDLFDSVLQTKPMTHREAFIVTCIEMTRMDGELSVQELNRCLDVLKTLGFSDEEFTLVENKLDQFDEQELILAIKDMVPVMKKNLLLAIQEIAGSDGVDDSEIEFIATIRDLIKST